MTSVRLTAVGDLMFYGPLAARMRATGDLLWGFRPLGDALWQGELLFGNLETPISAQRRAEAGAPDCYFSPLGIGRALKDYGFDVVNLAHNHIYDFGAEGVETTLQELAAAGLAHFGIGRDAEEAARPAIVTSGKGVTVGFLGYTTAHNAVDRRHAYVACPPSAARIARDVGSLRPRVGSVVVSCHTGSQFNPYPAPETRALARAAIAAGAALFLGHHPHVPQGWERIGDGLAVYSLGDFVAPVHNQQTRRTMLVRVELDAGRVTSHELMPCYITDDCQTTPAEGPLHAEIAAHLAEISQAVADGRSDALHFAVARRRFFSQYVTSWADEFRRGGIRTLWRKFRNLRPYHLQLIWRIVWASKPRA